MIDFYTWKTPNNEKVAIMLEEIGLPYQLHPINIGKQEQFTPEFLKINPNNKVPAIVDQAGPNNQPITVFESGAILIYLAEKSGQFIPSDLRQRTEVIEWLMFQMSGLGPMVGQAHHFLIFAKEPVPYAIERYLNETKRLYGVMEKRLSTKPYFAGDYSIADMAIFPWVREHEHHKIDLSDYPHLKRWSDQVAKRPAVMRGLKALASIGK